VTSASPGVTRLYSHIQSVFESLALVRFENVHAIENPEDTTVWDFSQVADRIDGCGRFETLESALRLRRHLIRLLVELVEAYLFNLRVNVVHRSRPSQHCCRTLAKKR
jgi:hypothetical protein